MHLQLTLIEGLVPLVDNSPTTTFSPWKHQNRPLQGVVHGLYVFGVLFEALGALAQSAPGVAPYGAIRRREIASELDAVEDIRTGLTSHGAELWKRLKATARPGPSTVGA
jgi:HEXXH motif-containing protein